MSELTGLAEALMVLGLFLVILVVIAYAVKPNSRSYRKYLVNLLVAGKVREVADKEKIDLIKEDALFNTYLKKTKIDRMLDIDTKLEEELGNKIKLEDKKK